MIPSLMVLFLQAEEMKDKAATEGPQEDFVDPWTVEASSNKGIDYDKLIGEWILPCLLAHSHAANAIYC